MEALEDARDTLKQLHADNCPGEQLPHYNSCTYCRQVEFLDEVLAKAKRNKIMTIHAVISSKVAKDIKTALEATCAERLADSPNFEAFIAILLGNLASTFSMDEEEFDIANFLASCGVEPK